MRSRTLLVPLVLAVVAGVALFVVAEWAESLLTEPADVERREPPDESN